MVQIKGTEWLSSINFGGIFTSIMQFVAFVLIILFVGGLVMLWLWNKKQKALFNQNIHFFEEVNGEFVSTEDYKAQELTIPDSNIKVFYIKEKNMYLPKGTRKMGKNSYWYCVRPNGDIINVKLQNLNTLLKELNLDFDYSDMRGMHLNLKELIKKNYSDKNIKWWKEYRDLIQIVVFCVVLTLSFWFLIYKMGGLVEKIGTLIELAKTCPAVNSGITQAVTGA